MSSRKATAIASREEVNSAMSALSKAHEDYKEKERAAKNSGRWLAILVCREGELSYEGVQLAMKYFRLDEESYQAAGINLKMACEKQEEVFKRIFTEKEA